MTGTVTINPVIAIRQSLNRLQMSRLLVITLQLLFLLLGPAGYAYLVYANWCRGYRVENWWKYQGHAMVLLLPLFLWLLLVLMMIAFSVATIYQEPKHRKSRFLIMLLAIVFLISLPTAFIKGLGSDAFDEGRKAMQSEISLRQLAEDCLALKTNLANDHAWLLGKDEVDQAIAFSPTIQRLRPNSISIYPDRVTLEFHGGMDHFGYMLIKDENTKQWNLEWYTESSNEKLLSISEPAK